MFSKLLLAVCGSLVVYTGVGQATTSGALFLAATAVENTSEVKSLLLAAIVRDYRVDPAMTLVSTDVLNLTDYANNSTSDIYNGLDGGQKADLARILKLNPDRFSKGVLDRFNRDQQVEAGMSSQDIRDLLGALRDIRNGEVLSKSQVSKIKDFMPLFASRPDAFIDELDPITQYASMNNQLFSSSDLSALRRDSMDAAGISADQNRVLMDVVRSGDSRPLTPDEIKTLQVLLLRSPIGALNGLDARDSLTIYQVVNHHSNLFSPAAVRSFDTAYGRNQAIQTYTAWKGQGSPPPTNRPQRSVTEEPVELNNPPIERDMMNRPEYMPLRPPVNPGARGIGR